MASITPPPDAAEDDDGEVVEVEVESDFFSRRRALFGMQNGGRLARLDAEVCTTEESSCSGVDGVTRNTLKSTVDDWVSACARAQLAPEMGETLEFTVRYEGQNCIVGCMTQQTAMDGSGVAAVGGHTEGWRRSLRFGISYAEGVQTKHKAKIVPAGGNGARVSLSYAQALGGKGRITVTKIAGGENGDDSGKDQGEDELEVEEVLGKNLPPGCVPFVAIFNSVARVSEVRSFNSGSMTKSAAKR